MRVYLTILMLTIGILFIPYSKVEYTAPASDELPLQTPPAMEADAMEGIICAEDCPLIDPKYPPGETEDLKELLQSTGESKQLPQGKIDEIAVVINCESEWIPDAVGDDGQSFGLAQINIPAHPNITPAQAKDPEFAIDFITSEFKVGNEWKWTCWNIHFALSPTPPLLVATN